MGDLTSVALRFLQLYGPIALCFFTFFESSMLFPFLPSEVVVPAAAALLITDPLSFLVFVLAASVGGTVGAFVPFYAFRDTRVGSTGWIRDRIAVSDEHIDRAQEWFHQWGRSSVFWGRFLPVLRSVVSIPAALARMEPKQFGSFTAAGTVGFYTAIGGVVYYGRQQSLVAAAVTVTTDNPGLVGVSILVFLGVGLLAKQWARSR